MLKSDDIRQIENYGSSVEKVSAQIERFAKGFPWLGIVAPATPGQGVQCLSEAEMDEAVAYAETAEVAGRCKFVPASGAASRMFKDIFAGLQTPNDAVRTLSENISRFAFYTPELFGPEADPAAVLLSPEGLDYGSKPKGVLKFHRYPDGEVRTALAEHLVEGQAYMRNADDSVNLHLTISEDHRNLFEAALEEVKRRYEERYGVKYEVTFSYQSKSTDTIAVTPEGRPFRKEDGTLLFRPGGHGALIHNLNSVPQELVTIKNIDNVAVERLLPLTARYKKVLIGRALELRDIIFGYLRDLDIASGAVVSPQQPYPYIPGINSPEEDYCATAECQDLCREIEQFLLDELCISIPKSGNCRDRVRAIRSKLNRPIRVCGMVRNQGEPGGGPFIVKAADGSTSLQILEGSQINPEDPAALECLKQSTHFNPVDIVCCLHDYRGQRFNLEDYVDEETGFISSKSYQGRPLKALELPGLWNGAMSDWNTKFVEVPLETFNPVKVVLDLLRPAHQNQ